MCVGDSSGPDVQCVLCYQTLGNSFMVPVKLKWYLYTKHVDCRHKPIAFLKSKCDELKHTETNLTSVIEAENENVCEPLYKVGHQTQQRQSTKTEFE
jgi:hypothetical protein